MLGLKQSCFFYLHGGNGDVAAQKLRIGKTRFSVRRLVGAYREKRGVNARDNSAVSDEFVAPQVLRYFDLACL